MSRTLDNLTRDEDAYEDMVEDKQVSTVCVNLEWYFIYHDTPYISFSIWMDIT